jgi:hypothetical protein
MIHWQLNVIGEFGMAIGIAIVVAMFVGKFGEKSNDLNACPAPKQY